ncbi:putative inner membrane protein [Botrimarina colliarenosi]|uniref:Putative inner membrane protein n=2 Tax=Botrimarina colliarenosi TaxID=2528001 RepID=A0A5C6A4H9_9BACT|nr:putative inner membrane protein [Botrimarina colliarenosi]
MHQQGEKMIDAVSQKSWSPYVVGSLIGILSWFSFATADKPLGITTAFEHAAALTWAAAIPDMAEQHPYFAAKRAEGKPPIIGWEAMLVVGVFFGALLSARLSGDQNRLWVPPMWERRFGPSKWKRLSAAFLSAALMMFGARLAQGCTSGHGISGSLQLAVSSWLFISIAFGVAILTALAMYRGQGVQDV